MPQEAILLLRQFSCLIWSAGVAFLESQFNLDLQHAMLLVPVAYALSGVAFYGAEAVMKRDPDLQRSV